LVVTRGSEMCSDKARPTVDELFELLKKTSLPTVLVEGKDDIIFYRAVEEELSEFGVDMLPAGNKDAVLDLQQRIIRNPVPSPMIFVVDNDLWVHLPPTNMEHMRGVITTDGYSIENDLFSDGDLESLLSADEASRFAADLSKFAKWYALSVCRKLNGDDSAFRTHPGKVLDDDAFYNDEVKLKPSESFPETLFNEIVSNYVRVLRGKSLFALLLRQLSSKRRKVKFSDKQLMAFGASRKGPNFRRICSAVRDTLEKSFAAQ